MCSGLTATSLSALSKLLANTEVADDIISIVRQVISQFSLKNVETESIEVPIGVKLWRVPGCHELLASLGTATLLTLIRETIFIWYLRITSFF